jgi:hypothetical protein
MDISIVALQLIKTQCSGKDDLKILLVEPTKLPLEDFFRQLTRLYQTAIPMGTQLSQLKRYPPWEILGLLYKFKRIYRRLRTAYKDYDGYFAE